MLPAPFTRALSDAAQGVLRPLVRILLRNGVPYGAFAEMARRVYAEVAQREFALPGKKQTVSRISTLTGLTRKDVTRIQSEAAPGAADHERYNRPARVIGGWVRDKRYHDRRGHPAELPMEGGTRSFSALVREFSGDIPPRAMADELARVGAIEVVPEKIGILGADVADLIRTIDHNLTCPPGVAYFQRRVSYDNVPLELLPALSRKLSRKAQSCLESMDRVLAAADRDRSAQAKGTGRARTGVGIYYFEERSE
jgi:hypothetical protein